MSDRRPSRETVDVSVDPGLVELVASMVRGLQASMPEHYAQMPAERIGVLTVEYITLSGVELSSEGFILLAQTYINAFFNGMNYGTYGTCVLEDIEKTRNQSH